MMAQSLYLMAPSLYLMAPSLYLMAPSLYSRRVGRRRRGSHGLEMLAGRSAIVTGAGRGIGQAVSRLLGQHGASVLVNDLDEAAAHASAAAVTAAGESP